MIVADTSAFLAILFQEPDAQDFADAIQQADQVALSAASLLEASIVVLRARGESGLLDLDQLLLRSACDIVAFDVEQASLARQAYRDYGKGRHAAGLNLGDCFSYALAKDRGSPLLYKGGDFSKTDVESVI